jgi:hypothetical protein
MRDGLNRSKPLSFIFHPSSFILYRLSYFLLRQRRLCHIMAGWTRLGRRSQPATDFNFPFLDEELEQCLN